MFYDLFLMVLLVFAEHFLLFFNFAGYKSWCTSRSYSSWSWAFKPEGRSHRFSGRFCDWIQNWSRQRVSSSGWFQIRGLGSTLSKLLNVKLWYVSNCCCVCQIVMTTLYYLYYQQLNTPLVLINSILNYNLYFDIICTVDNHIKYSIMCSGKMLSVFVYLIG